MKESSHDRCTARPTRPSTADGPTGPSGELPASYAPDVVHEAVEAVIVADRSGVIRRWNPSAARMFGCSAEEAVGRPVDLIVPQELRAAHWGGYRHAVFRGVLAEPGDLAAAPAVHRDGTRLSVEFHATLLHDDRGQVYGVAAVLRDVTAGTLVLRWTCPSRRRGTVRWSSTAVAGC
ncbi:MULTISPECIES: PAS domain-containing protein [unclassified Streptomyces]|uniref:PAS domain-containing protein n=1 Tax=unclassified Streptomyces TaxID=2593676 RepID=UPI003D93078E